jgi:hypothetical protein
MVIMHEVRMNFFPVRDGVGEKYTNRHRNM